MVTLVIGCLGGFGSQLIHWLFDKNCCNIIITSRTGFLSDHYIYTLTRVIALRMRTIVFEHDLAEHISALECQQ